MVVKKKVMPRKNKNEYNEYMKKYMRDYRKLERDFIRKAKKQLGWTPPKKQKRKRGKR